MIFTLAALGLPGTSGFVGEFLVLVGAFQKNILVAVLASLGVILAAAYMLWLYRRVVFGKILNPEIKEMSDLNRTELCIFGSELDLRAKVFVFLALKLPNSFRRKMLI